MQADEILYTKNRRAYVKISEEGKVIFSIPERWKQNRKLLAELEEKADQLLKRFEKRTRLEKWNAEGIFLFGERVRWEEVPEFDRLKQKQRKTKRESFSRSS
jgi:hypothetical protein